MSAIPKWTKPPVDVPVQALREFAAKYGQDVTVMVTWTHETNSYQFVTAGSDRLYSDSAVDLRDIIAKGLGMAEDGPAKEDLRGDHPNVVLTKEQIDFLVWGLGYLTGALSKRSTKHKDYLNQHHDAVAERLNQARSLLEKAPKA
jgi:hypothetical protein